MSDYYENRTAFVPIHSLYSQTKGPLPHMTYTTKIVSLCIGVCALTSLLVSTLFVITRLTALRARAKKASAQDKKYRG
jgi:hypothetical protein